MATRVFSEEELAQLRGFPEIPRDELIQFFTLTAADRAFVDPGRGRSPRDRLGLGVQLCTLAWLGFVADALGYHPVTTAKLAVQAAGTWSRYAAGDHLRSPSSWTPRRTHYS